MEPVPAKQSDAAQDYFQDLIYQLFNVTNRLVTEHKRVVENLKVSLISQPTTSRFGTLLEETRRAVNESDAGNQNLEKSNIANTAQVAQGVSSRSVVALSSVLPSRPGTCSSAERIENTKMDRRSSMPVLLGSRDTFEPSFLKSRAKYPSAPPALEKKASLKSETSATSSWGLSPRRRHERKPTPAPNATTCFSQRAGRSLNVETTSRTEVSGSSLAQQHGTENSWHGTPMNASSLLTRRSCRSQTSDCDFAVATWERCPSYSYSSESSQYSPRKRRCSSSQGSRAPSVVFDGFSSWPTWTLLKTSDPWEFDSESPTFQRQHTYMTVMQTLNSCEGSKDPTAVSAAGHYLQKLVMHPQSFKRLSWVFLGTLFISYDLVTSPLWVFSFEDSGFSRSMIVIGSVFWTLDFPASFFTGYYVKTNVEMSLPSTVRYYARSWMFFDAALIIADWLVVMAVWNKGLGMLRALRLFRSAQALRSLKLLRAIRVPKTLQRLLRVLGHSEYAWLMLSLSCHMLGILLINHFIACAWFFIGSGEHGWVSVFKRDSYVAKEMLYFTALHWSLTQFTPATMSVQPQTFVERVFAVSVLLFALIVFSSFVSSITNLMTHLFNLNSTEAKQFMKLDRYLHSNSISFRLSVRIRRYLEHLQSDRQNVLQEADAALLSKLSTPLRMELKYEVHFPLLSKHPFFLYFSLTNLPIVQRICLEVLQTISHGAGDVAFGVGDTAWAMYFIARGLLLYQKQGDRLPSSVNAGMWVCESVLWTPWEHRGNMRAVTEASLLALDAEKFHKIMGKNKTAAQQPASYALEAVDHLNTFKRAELSDLDHLYFDYEAMARRAFEIEEQDEGAIQTAKDWFMKKVHRSSFAGSTSFWRRSSIIGTQVAPSPPCREPGLNSSETSDESLRGSSLS